MKLPLSAPFFQIQSKVKFKDYKDAEDSYIVP